MDLYLKHISQISNHLEFLNIQARIIVLNCKKLNLNLERDEGILGELTLLTERMSARCIVF